jgi:energy-coupling factor transporter ATP-binding protein EcfA2
LTACQSALNTQRISLQVNSLRSQLLTMQLNKSIVTEIENLHLNHIPFMVEEDSRRGESRYGVALDAKSRVENRHVLSEGEQRALALACYFAEIRSIPGKIGILLDDPVSSLDQRRTRLVAERIVQEAETGRQVIIFTHNLVFFKEVLAFAARSQIKIMTHCVRTSTKDGVGVILQDESPWLVKKVGARIAHLKALRSSISIQADTQPEEYRKAVVDFYTDLRAAWERLVEEQLLGGVVMRFQEEIKTKKLALVTVDDADYQAVYWAMKNASEWTHDMAAGKTIAYPTIDKMKKDIDELETYYSKIRKRNNELEKKREDIENAPKATTI